MLADPAPFPAPAAINCAAERYDLAERSSDCDLRVYGRREDCDPHLLPDGHFLQSRISAAQGSVDRHRAALYAAEHGPIFEPFCIIQSGTLTVFDRVLQRLKEAIEPVIARLPLEWTENYEAWDALDPPTRFVKAWPVYAAAALSRHSISGETRDLRVTEMWQSAQIAHRLKETLVRGHQPLLEGALLIAQMGYLTCTSADYERDIEDPYPVADLFPTSFNEADQWSQYAAILDRLKRIAPMIGVTDMDVSDALCAAEQLALTHRECAMGRCDGASVGRAAVHLDPVRFSQAYWRIRRGISDRVRNLIRDRGVMWAEAFGQWASEVSTIDAARDHGVLPAAVRVSDEQAKVSIDNASRELILVGHAFTVSGEAGQIFRPIANADWGIDGEIEFKDYHMQASGKRVYLQLKSGDSYLYHRQSDGAEVLAIRSPRHAEYWQQQAYPVMLVIRTSDGEIRWMDVTSYLKCKAKKGDGPVRQIMFEGEPFTAANVQRMRDRVLQAIEL